MIKGIGTDIVEISRIEEKICSSDTFLSHVFAVDEIEYCSKQKNKYMHFAARWAVKEAYLKAYGLKFIGNHRLYEIETKHTEDGKPYINLVGKAKQEFDEKGFEHIHVSISHTNTYAIAYVIIE